MNDDNNIEPNKSVAFMTSVLVYRMAMVNPICQLSLFFLLIHLLDNLNFLFELHSSILKPDFHLSLSNAKLVGHFNSSSPCDIVICVKLFLQF